jgi:sugar diacid utilization regulator
LNVHVNTVRNRLERVTALSGRDPQSFLDSVDLYIALWAADNKKRTGYRLIKPLN